VLDNAFAIMEFADHPVAGALKATMRDSDALMVAFRDLQRA
jgi:hypothetical protein